MVKVIFSDKRIVRRPDRLAELLQQRIQLIWNYRITEMVQRIVFTSSLTNPYEIVQTDNGFDIYFGNDTLLSLVHSGKGLLEFDSYLRTIENKLIWQI